MKTPFPIFINAFNHLPYIRDAVEFLAGVPGVTTIVIDNNSSSLPLQAWYESAPCEVVRLSRNLGHMAPWLCGVIDRYAGSHYAVTDFDLDLTGLPSDFPARLVEVLEEYPEVSKCGPALRINDIPSAFPLREQVELWEQRFWGAALGADRYQAPIDTTLAVYSRHRKTHDDFYSAVRVAGEFAVRHRPWYWTPQTLTDADIFYICSSKGPSGWKRALIFSFCRSDPALVSRIQKVVSAADFKAIQHDLDELTLMEQKLETERPSRVLLSAVGDGAIAWFIGQKLRQMGHGLCVVYGGSGEHYQTVRRLTLGLPIDLRVGILADAQDEQFKDFDLVLS